MYVSVENKRYFDQIFHPSPDFEGQGMDYEWYIGFLDMFTVHAHGRKAKELIYTLCKKTNEN